MDKYELKAIWLGLQRIRAEHELTANDLVDVMAAEQLVTRLAMEQFSSETAD